MSLQLFGREFVKFRVQYPFKRATIYKLPIPRITISHKSFPFFKHARHYLLKGNPIHRGQLLFHYFLSTCYFVFLPLFFLNYSRESQTSQDPRIALFEGK